MTHALATLDAVPPKHTSSEPPPAPRGRRYTITFPRRLWRQARALAVLRGQENEEFIVQAVRDELKRDAAGHGLQTLPAVPTKTDDQATYSFEFPADLYAEIKMYCAKRPAPEGRDPTVRSFLHSVVTLELELARKSGELVTTLR